MGPGLLTEHVSSTGGEDNTQGSAMPARSIRLPPCRAPKLDMVDTQQAPPAKLPPRRASQAVSSNVKISPRVSQKRLRFGDDVGKREFIKFAKKYHQQLEEECASVGRITVRAMSPPQLADIGVLLQEAEEATRD